MGPPPDSGAVGYRVTLRRQGAGFVAECSEPTCSVSAASREEALRKIREEILFSLETCTCDKVPPSSITLEVQER